MDNTATNDNDRDPRVAWDRAETDPCEKGTPGCCIKHPVGTETECETW